MSTTTTDQLSIASPLGELFLVASPHGIARLAFDDEDWDDVLSMFDQQPDPASITAARPYEDPSDHLERAHRQLDEYFGGERQHFDVPVDLSSTRGFRRRALEYLETTDYGSTTSYGRVATAVGSPRAARAVGSACAVNPVPILVPCHRVLTAAGGVGGYLGGLARKEFLLDLERATLARTHQNGSMQ